MLGPVLRLLAIYLCVGLAVWGFFNRDKLMVLARGQSPAAENSAAAAPGPAPEPVQQPAAETTPAAPAAPVTPAAPAAPVFAPMPGQPEAASERVADTTGLDYQGQWNAARQAYWDGKVDEAVARYRALLEVNPDDGPLNGELANILYTRNRRDEAVPHFERAGIAAARSGNQAEVSMIISVLRALSPEAAQRVSDAQAAGNGQGNGQ